MFRFIAAAMEVVIRILLKKLRMINENTKVDLKYIKKWAKKQKTIDIWENLLKKIKSENE